jgi:malonate decarboxylase beta subunit
MAAASRPARRDWRTAGHLAGAPAETGGVRLQEANLSEAVVAEIMRRYCAARTGHRRHHRQDQLLRRMSITAGLCSYLVVLPQARLELNGPEVIEQEAGIEELDSSDKQLVWSLMGGEQRYETGFADALIEDDAELLRQTIRDLAARGVPARHRSAMVDEYRRRLAAVDPAAPPDGHGLRGMWPKGEGMSATAPGASRGRTWFQAWPTTHSR